MRFGTRLVAAVAAFGLAWGLADGARAQSQAPVQWGGLYVGGNAGYGVATANTTGEIRYDNFGYFNRTSTPAYATAAIGRVKPRSFMGGVTAGYNWQSGALVYGAEFDFAHLRAGATRTSGAVYPCCAPSSFQVEQSVKLNYVATLRARAGYASDRWLVYGTAGAAFTTLKYSESFTDNFAGANELGSQSGTRTGWVVGMGAEYALGEHWSMKGEYQHVDFGSMNGAGGILSDNLGNRYPMNVYTHAVNVRLDMWRVGVNYRF